MTTNNNDNDILVNSENIKVIVRCRPMNAKEKIENRKHIVEVDTGSNVITLHNHNNTKQYTTKNQISFNFDHVFNEDSRQQEIYATCAKPIIQSVLNGYYLINIKLNF